MVANTVMPKAARRSGIGSLSVASLIAVLTAKAEAGSQDITFLTNGTLGYKDLLHGVVEVETKGAISRSYTLADPEFSLVIEQVGSSYLAEMVRNSAARMAELEANSHAAHVIFRMGQEGLTFQRRADATFSSGTVFDLVPLSYSPTNFIIVTQNSTFVPQDVTSPNTDSNPHTVVVISSPPNGTSTLPPPNDILPPPNDISTLPPPNDISTLPPPNDTSTSTSQPTAGGSAQPVIVSGLDPNDFDYRATGTNPSGTHEDAITVIGTSGVDTILGGTSTQTIYGGPGDDKIFGNTSTDIVFGGSGNDLIIGDNGTDELYGGSGNDEIQGGQGSDIIIGGYGADLLTGGILPGNSGAPDTFKFLSVLDSPAGSGQFDVITDFVSGTDKLDFSSIDGIDSITPGPLSDVTLNAHSIGWVTNADGSIDVYVNTTDTAETIGSSGSDAPNMQVHLDSVTSLNNLNDFII